MLLLYYSIIPTTTTRRDDQSLTTPTANKRCHDDEPTVKIRRSTSAHNNSVLSSIISSSSSSSSPPPPPTTTTTTTAVLLRDINHAITPSTGIGSSSSNNSRRVNLRDSVMYPSYKVIIITHSSSSSLSYCNHNQSRLAIFDDYEFFDKAGEGAFGKVLVVRHKITKHVRACKAMGVIITIPNTTYNVVVV